MGKLEDELRNFAPGEELKKLNKQFEELAKTFLYGGYISVMDSNEERYRIYIRTVEFYCHYEGDTEEDWRKDWIVYHRNNHYVEGNVPYFPLMAFHAHASGYDITFENAEKELRSSALIRAYEIYDVNRGCFLVYRSKTDDGKDCKKFVKYEKGNQYNTQSTYLYNFLNGFCDGSVKWIDQDVALSSDNKMVSQKPRQNVPQFEKDGITKKCQPGDTKKLTPDERPWSFTRKDEINYKKPID